MKKPAESAGFEMMVVYLLSNQNHPLNRIRMCARVGVHPGKVARRLIE